MSPHEVDLRDLLGAARLTGHLPEQFMILGAQPASIELAVG